MNKKPGRGKVGQVDRLRLLFQRLVGKNSSTLPNFFVLGAARAGSTTLHHMLSEHPSIFMPRKKKELHYFDNDMVYRQDLSGYHENFLGYSGQAAVGEVTPLYFEKGTLFDASGEISFFNDEDSIIRIARHFPDARLIISLRDPYTRAQSIQYKNFMQGKVNATIDNEVTSEIDGESRLKLIYRNRYDIHLRHVLDYFPRDQVKIIVFEQWTRDLRTTVDDVSDFLTIPRCDLVPELNAYQANKRQRYDKNREKSIAPEVEMTAPVKDLFLERLESMYPFLHELGVSTETWTRRTG